MQPPQPPPKTPGDSSTAGQRQSSQSDTASTRADGEATSGGVPEGRELQLPIVVGGRYRLEQFRGGGGMAKVYRGVDMNLERDVAVKLINPELRSGAEFDIRFQREARIASQLSDPHIVVVHDFGLDAVHGPFLVMEYLHGLSLRERLTAEGPLPLKAGLQLAGQLLLALIHAHDRGIVHRDIKPDNVFLLNQSGVKLHTRILDFGIARIYRDDQKNDQTAITSVGAVLGTPRYMAPEQLAGMPADARTDLYAAALVIFETLTGQLPYLQSKKLTDLCPEASPQLQDLLENCLKASPTERPANAIEVYLRLTELGKASGVLLLPPGALTRLVATRKAHEPTIAYTGTIPGKQPPWFRQRKWLAVIGLLLVLGIGGLAGWLWFSNQPPPSGPAGLLGVSIGDNPDTVERVQLTRIDLGNPWKLSPTKDSMGKILLPEYLGIAESDLGKLTTRSTLDHRTQVLSRDDKILAVVTHQAGVRCRRGVTIGTSLAAVLSAYDDQRYQMEDVDLPDGGHVQLLRYRAMGVGFEIQNKRVVGMALFPPQGS